MADDRSLEEIRARVDLADLIASYGVQVRRSGSGTLACCPFHNERTPSFHINTAKGFYHCFGCGESGDAFKFVQKMEGLTFPEALRKLAERTGVRLEPAREDPSLGERKRLLALMAELAQFYRRCLLKTKEAQLARDYLASRNLAGEVGSDWLIGYAPQGAAHILTWAEKHGFTPEELEAAGVIRAPDRPGDAGYHRFGGRLMFSIRDRQGRVVAFSGRQLVENKRAGKYVNSPETLIFRKSSVLFGFDRAAACIARAPHREALVCEGQIDCIRLHLCGFPVAVASQGTAFTEEHARMLRRVADQVLLVFDDDAAGHKATVRTAGMLLAAEMPVRTVSLPGGDDPDSFLRRKGAEAFRALLAGAESIVSFQCRVERAKEANPSTVDAVARISNAVLGTIAQCPNAVLRASMVAEVAQGLSLPVAALSEELERLRRMRPASVAAPVALQPDEGPEELSPSEDNPVLPTSEAASVEPPSALERSFMEFLFTHERDVQMSSVVGEFVPPGVLAHAFTVGFVETWRQACGDGGGSFETFVGTLDAPSRRWFEQVVVRAGRSEACVLEPFVILQDFVRKLWIAHLRRLRGALPAQGDEAADLKRMRISTDVRRLDMVKWETVKEMVREWIKHPVAS